MFDNLGLNYHSAEPEQPQESRETTSYYEAPELYRALDVDPNEWTILNNDFFMR
ncbi:hypothetical protein ACRTC3_07650 [Photobacterium damselae]|uniref:hypothetical protein n=1 Tax=Photobacterium damselae TaxID=38293 RepID=UPI003D7E2803